MCRAAMPAVRFMLQSCERACTHLLSPGSSGSCVSLQPPRYTSLGKRSAQDRWRLEWLWPCRYLARTAVKMGQGSGDELWLGGIKRGEGSNAQDSAVCAGKLAIGMALALPILGQDCSRKGAGQWWWTG